MKGEGLLKAATETLVATTERIERDREADRRTMTALLHQVEEVTEKLWELSARAGDVEQALSMAQTGGMLKTPRMAQRIDMHPATLRKMAADGRVRGYQSVELGDWLFDPREVVIDIKRVANGSTPTASPYTSEAIDRAADMVQDDGDEDRFKDARHVNAHYEQVAKEWEARQ